MCKSKIRCLTFSVALAALIGCGSTPKKAEIPEAANAPDEISRLEQDIQTGYSNHYDLLADKDFAEAQKYLKSAKREVSKKNDPGRALEDVAYGRAYLNRSTLRVEKLTPYVAGILEARSEALAAGARDTKAFRARLKDLDDGVRDDAEDGYGPRDFARVQKGYLNLELDAIENRQLGDAREMIRKARDARRSAPRTLAQAEMDLRNAENQVAANRHDSSRYSTSVAQANASARLLTDVLAITNRRGAKVDEKAALAQVRQARQITALQGQVGSLRGQLGVTGHALQQRNRELADVSARADLHALLNRVQKEFDPKDAEVFEQNDRVIIRLKSMNFPSGRADIPSTSLPLLAKVKSVAEELDPSEIMIEGHTDAVGSEVANKKLSQKRAEAVASYFESEQLNKADIKTEGESFNKPIASNKSKEGRAQNRRVDVIITPNAVANFGTDAE